MEDVDANIVQVLVDTARARRKTVAEASTLEDNAGEVAVDSVSEAGELEGTAEQVAEGPAPSQPSLETQLDRARKEIRWYRMQELKRHRISTTQILAYRGPPVARNELIESDGTKKMEKVIQASITAYDRILRYLYTLKEVHHLDTFYGAVDEGNEPLNYEDWMMQEMIELSKRKAIPNDFAYFHQRDMMFFDKLVTSLDVEDEEVAEMWHNYQNPTDETAGIYPLDALISVLHTPQAEALAASIVWIDKSPNKAKGSDP